MPNRSHTVTLMAGIQWLGFMFANTVVIPLSTSTAFHLSQAATAGVMARSFILTGLACLLQAWFGHRLPLMEGQSGLWWGVILNLIAMSASLAIPFQTIGGSLALGMLLGGVLLILLGVAGMHRFLNRLFTPVVMAVLLFLLAAQLIDIFFKGMLGIQGNGALDGQTTLLSIGIVVLVGALTIAAKGLLSNFSILIGLSVGWVAFVLVKGTQAKPIIPTWHHVAQTFAWGPLAGTGAVPVNLGIVIATVVTALINTTNTIATLRAAEPVFQRSVPDGAYRRSLVWSGALTMASGVFAQVPYAPYTSSIGFLRTSRLLDRAPFILGAVLFTVMGLIPYISGFFSTMPYAVGAAVLFVAYLQLFGAALQNLEGIQFSFRGIFRIALPVLAGLAIQTLPTNTFSTLPGFAQSLVGNGMLVGILLSILLESLVPWNKLERLQ